jgi:hypothetical protein
MLQYTDHVDGGETTSLDRGHLLFIPQAMKRAWRAMVIIMLAGENFWRIQHSSLAILPAVIWEQVGGMDKLSENFT